MRRYITTLAVRRIPHGERNRCPTSPRKAHHTPPDQCVCCMDWSVATSRPQLSALDWLMSDPVAHLEHEAQFFCVFVHLIYSARVCTYCGFPTDSRDLVTAARPCQRSSNGYSTHHVPVHFESQPLRCHRRTELDGRVLHMTIAWGRIQDANRTCNRGTHYASPARAKAHHLHKA